MSCSSPAIEIDQLTKVFGRGAKSETAVDRVSMQIRSGEIVGFLGPNGAGKTTTIKMICGLVTPISGSIKVHGYDLRRQRKHATRRIGAVLEGARNVYWRLSAWQNLLYFGRLKGVPRRQITPIAERLLRTLELWDRRDERIRHFSRGMQQKVAIACALVSDPPVLLLDEPTLGLDVEASRAVKDIVRRLAQEEGKAILLTTHQLDIAQELCHRVAIIRRGRLVADKPIDELLSLFGESHAYEITVSGELDFRSNPVPHMTMTHEDRNTVLRGAFSSQEHMSARFAQVQRADLDVISVVRATPDLEDVFIELSNGHREVA
ncbi:MAG: ABC transporter [Chloroflexi bacterium]|jgi:ABC-2 type transport system ATP-binding protein|nr:ABC transporter [Chloroflexota bacterium]MDP6420667.1 ABC transporter ATP-binding protein [SAR202 cluster bacterium]